MSYWTLKKFTIKMVRVLPQGIISEMDVFVTATDLKSAEEEAKRELSGWQPSSYWEQP